jgi:hypothetical protein
VAEIQREVIEQSGRDTVPRLVDAKNDEETVAAWKLKLNRILHGFNVRSVVSVRPSPTIHYQSELAIDTNADVSNITNTSTVVANTNTDIHNNMPQSQEGTEDQQQLVRASRIHRQQK